MPPSVGAIVACVVKMVVVHDEGSAGEGDSETDEKI